MRWKSVRGIRGAALSLRDGRALYAELLDEDGVYSLVNAQMFDLPPGLVENDRLNDGERLGKILRKKCAFRWGKLPLALGIPSSDCIFRLFDLPAADLNEARGAMRWCFSDYFPYKYDEALFDVCGSSVPFSGEKLRLLGAACAKEHIMPILESLKNSRCRVQAVEPQIIACVRALSSDGGGAQLLIVAMKRLMYLAFIRDGEPFLFRSVPLDSSNSSPAQIETEIRKTTDFVAEKFGVREVRIHLAGELPVSVDAIPLLSAAQRKRTADFHRLKFVPPADPDWFDVAGLLLRFVHETEFNLIPPEYARPRSLSQRIFSLQCAMILILLCGAFFFWSAHVLTPRLLAEAEEARRERESVTERTKLLNRRCGELADDARYWKNVLGAAESSVPALEILSALFRALPETASVETFSADGGRVQLEILFADPETVSAFMRRAELMPYGPLRVVERRFVQQGALLFRFEAPRRK